MAELILYVTRGRDQLLDITTLMLRHRPVGRARHRAKRQGLWPARAVRLDAAQHGSVEASPLPQQRPPERSLAELLGQALRSHIFRLVRGAVVTPWFAVSVGIVIATSLTLARPHPALTFPPSVGGRCFRARCGSPPTSPSAPGPAIKHGVILTGPRPGANARLAGVKLEYGLLSSHGNHFMSVILIVSRHSLGWWQLRFSLPGGKVDDIMWAKWRSEGQAGIIVMGSPAPWSGSADGSSVNETRLIVIGTGTPAWPAGCRFDGASCHFRHNNRVGGRMRGYGQRAQVTAGGQE